MSSGGYRPGAGRPKGSGDKSPKRLGNQNARKKGKLKKNVPLSASDREKIREILAVDLETREKAKKYAGLLEQSSKGKLTAPEKKEMDSLRAELEKRLDDGEKKEAVTDPDAKLFLETLLIAPDSDVDRRTKIQIANILLPYQHARKGESMGKKDEKNERAKSAAGGRFKPSAPPVLKVVNK